MSATCLISENVLGLEELRELLAEAAQHRPGAKRCDRPGWRVVDGWQFLGPARFWYSLEGEVREEVQLRLAERVTELIQRRLYPVQSNYLYYDDGDFLGLHHDQARCPFAVIALLSGDAEPLCVHPELIDMPLEDLVALVEPEGHQGGKTMALQEGPLLLSGGVLPHHREPHAGTEPITIVTFCFGVEPASSQPADEDGAEG